jgi:hypothetical protein
VTLFRRAVAAPSRPLVVWADLGLSLWAIASLPLAILPYGWRWRLARLLARPALRFGRAPAAIECAKRMLLLETAAAHAAIQELYAARLATMMDIVRGLTLGCDYAIRLRGLEHLAPALACGRGAILWTADFPAAGEATKIALSRAGWPLAHLSRIEHGFSKSRYGIRVLNPLRVRFEKRYLAERILYDRLHPDEA